MKAINILLVEDNEGDIVLTAEAFEKSKLINKLQIIKDGKQAILFFENLNEGSEQPNLVLLDINLPKVSGHEVLKYIKSHDKHKNIPVIMLTTSSSEKDINQSYENSASLYITKPIDVADFSRTIGKIEDFWMNTVSENKK
jgi:CheY-like chemotaxis protein